MRAVVAVQIGEASLGRESIGTLRQVLGRASGRQLSTSIGAEKSAEQSGRFEPESWVQRHLTKAIGQALLDAERNTIDKKKLLELLQEAGIVKSYLHFRESIRMLEKMKRVEVFCKGPVKIGSRERKFSVQLTSRGRHVYRWHRLNPTASSGLEPKNFAMDNRTGGRGLSDAL